MHPAEFSQANSVDEHVLPPATHTNQVSKLNTLFYMKLDLAVGIETPYEHVAATGYEHRTFCVSEHKKPHAV